MVKINFQDGEDIFENSYLLCKLQSNQSQKSNLSHSDSLPSMKLARIPETSVNMTPNALTQR